MEALEPLTLERVAREQDMEALEAYRKGLAEPPVIYKSVTTMAQRSASDLMLVVASEETPDRMGDVVRVEGWDLKAFKKNPVLLFMHNPLIPPIGTVPKVWVEGKQLLANIVFDEEDPLAALIKGKYERGVMRAVSVGFRPIEFARRSAEGDLTHETYEFTRQELLELSAVPIPAHPAALRKMMASAAFRILVPGLSDAVAKTLRDLADEIEVGGLAPQKPPDQAAAEGVLTPEEAERIMKAVAGLGLQEG